MYHGMIQQLSQTGNKLSICLISWVEWEDYCAGSRQMILLLIDIQILSYPPPLTNALVLDECDCFDPGLTPLSWSLWASWGLGVELSPGTKDAKLSMIYAVMSQNTKLYFYSVDNYNYNTTLFCVLQICGTFCFPRPWNFWIFNDPRGIELCSGLLTCTKLEFAKALKSKLFYRLSVSILVR